MVKVRMSIEKPCIGSIRYGIPKAELTKMPVKPAVTNVYVNKGAFGADVPMPNAIEVTIAAAA